MTSDILEITALFARLAALLDDSRPDDAHTVYADDVTVHSPRGRLHGIAAVTSFLRGSSVDGERTQHMHGDVLVDVDGDTASAAATQLVHFFRAGAAPHRTSGLRVRCTAVRTPAGWRFRESHIDLAWTTAPI